MGKLTELKKAMADAEEEHNALLKTLQSTFKESQEKMEKLKETSAPQIKLLKAATLPCRDGRLLSPLLLVLPTAAPGSWGAWPRHIVTRGLAPRPAGAARPVKLAP